MIRRLKRKSIKATRLYQNFKPAMLLALVPILVGIVSIGYVFSDYFQAQLAQRGSNRLISENWQAASDLMVANQPDYGPRASYYVMEENQDLVWASYHFGVPLDQLKELNPGQIVYGTTIKVPPVQRALDPLEPDGFTDLPLTVAEADGAVIVSNQFNASEVRTTIPQLAEFLKPYDVMEQVSPRHFRILRPLIIKTNIRLDITSETIDKLELRSAPDFDFSCLCFEDAEVLISDVWITSYDPATGQPDYDHSDGRGFIRALRSTRMDVINSSITHLGHGLYAASERTPIMSNGATYGISWRIIDGSLGRDLVTGWVENSTFSKNNFGSYTFGASGMMWRGNLFTENDVYGLDPHDDSNSATIENNQFLNNGKHGFIVSKRCNYNVIRNNISTGNGLHGFMLHQDSVYNLMENNIASGNTDNFAIYASSFNTVRGNSSYAPRASHLRINEGSVYTYVQNNLFHGGPRGVHIYGQSRGVLVIDNVFYGSREVLSLDEDSSNLVMTHNTVDKLAYELGHTETVAFGPNTVKNQDPLK